MLKETKPTLVPQSAKQVGEIHDRWSWVEPSVWTARMLTALETGVKGGKWFSLIDKVRGKDHQRWTNAYFAEHGLFSLVVAHEQLVNPRRGTNINRRAVCGRTARTVRREG